MLPSPTSCLRRAARHMNERAPSSVHAPLQGLACLPPHRRHNSFLLPSRVDQTIMLAAAVPGEQGGGLSSQLPRKYQEGQGTPMAPSPDRSGADSSHGFHITLGVAVLVLLNCGVFLAATVFKSAAVASLAINPAAVTWWSFITSAFVHHNTEQLGRNIFVVLFFSQLVYRDLGAVGVWVTYLLGAVGANVSSWVFLAGTSSVKALSMLGVASSGGALTVFLAALALSFRPSLAWALGAAVSANFILRVLLEAPASAAAAAAAAATAATPSAGLPLGQLLDPAAAVSNVTALLKSLKASAASPGNSWAVGAVLAAAVVVLLARLPDPEAN